ncbi:hypothetical protein BJ165DRAFT_254703 [Panaeolus papilionaceus]|nr:hypothetical protein BJ165DRAFT_254703 [Panaeolus papilionaceus]
MVRGLSLVLGVPNRTAGPAPLKLYTKSRLMADVSRLLGFIRPIIYVGTWFINLIPASSEPPSSDSPPPPAAPFNSFCNMLGGVLLALAASMGLVDGMSLVPRQTQSQAICASSFQWMNNHAGDSPCIVASKLGGICNSGNWVIKSIVGPDGTASFHYPNPGTSNQTANFCTCSWSYYNVLSACTACQNGEFLIPFWSDYKSQCSSFETSRWVWCLRCGIALKLFMHTVTFRPPTHYRHPSLYLHGQY